MGFLYFARLHNPVPLHKHDFKVIYRQPLLPIVDGYQEQIVEKCKVCGATETKLKYGPVMLKLGHLDYICSFGSKDCIINYRRNIK